MADQEQANFTGWAVVEVLGHRTIAGYCTTKYFGPAAMIYITQPESSSERTLASTEWVNSERCAAGTKIRNKRVFAEYYIGAGSIYQLTPCPEAVALSKIPGEVEIIERVVLKEIAAPIPLPDDD
jgi:hypothetical protein